MLQIEIMEGEVISIQLTHEWRFKSRKWDITEVNMIDNLVARIGFLLNLNKITEASYLVWVFDSTCTLEWRYD